MGRYEIVNRLKKKEIDGNDLLKMYKDQVISKELYDELSQDYPSGEIVEETPKKKPAAETAIENNQTDQANLNTSNKDLDLGSKIYSNIASTFGAILATVGLFIFLLYGGVEGFGLLIGFAILGVFLYLSISLFGRVLKGLEQNNKLLKKFLKSNKKTLTISLTKIFMTAKV